MAATQASRATATRRRLIDAARRAFGRFGYSGASIEVIVATAEVTKGALYHHFGDKRALFRGVFIDEQRRLVSGVDRAVDQEADPLQQLFDGCDEYLRLASEPAARQIVLIDGPAVLGWKMWRKADERIWIRHLTQVVSQAQESGVLVPAHADLIARMISGALTELALAQSASCDVLLHRLIGGLSKDPSTSRLHHPRQRPATTTSSRVGPDD
jgi:AcrR family transcriptional regulator